MENWRGIVTGEVVIYHAEGEGQGTALGRCTGGRGRVVKPALIGNQ